MTIRYAEGSISTEVREVCTWKRGDIPAAVMSASSGPKDYFKNEVFARFQSDPEIQAIKVLTLTNRRSKSYGATFAVYLRDNRWVDLSGRAVSVEGAE